MPPMLIGDLVRRVYWKIAKLGAAKFELKNGSRIVDAYVRIKGRMIEVGNRQDFHDLGFDFICDLLDKAPPLN